MNTSDMNTSDQQKPEPSARLGSLLCRALIGHRLGGVWLLLAIALFVGFLTRAFLAMKEAGQVSWDASIWKAGLWGFVFDLASSLWWLGPIALLLAALPNVVATSRIGRIFLLGGIAVCTYALLFGAAAEWLFWDEFGIRFNFIAVDYLVYTTEVIGNIRESYPMWAIFSGVLVATVAVITFLHLSGLLTLWLDHCATGAGVRWRGAIMWCNATLVLGLTLNERHLPAFANSYNQELAKNGLWSLFAAFRANQLEFDQFYSTMSVDEAFVRVGDQLRREGAGTLEAQSQDMLRTITSNGTAMKLNVIQITVESLSASFLARYGNSNAITPTLDALAGEALVFDRFYATGTRTDRGMEALTLSVPPTPGRSLVKRPDNGGLFTLGSVFRDQGYSTAFVYGGFGYFDNMNAFFGGNGYRVVDRNSVERADITFSNVWGACDEDLYRWELREADRDFAEGKPFFHFVMTTSNHRPYTFPEGRIDLPSKTSGRNGAVKYSDFAIGEFFRQARSKPWFNQTVFVIVGDHCASSAGKTTLPVQNYHVPLMIYAPGGQIARGVVEKAASQIDYAPTLLGLMNWSYRSRFFGRDVLAADAAWDGPLFIGTYQKLGMFKDDHLAVLEPVRRRAVYDYDQSSHRLTPCTRDSDVLLDSIAYYQVASWVFRNRVQRAEKVGGGDD